MLPVKSVLYLKYSFAIVILSSCKIYFACIYTCKWTNVVCWLCISETNHTYTV